MAKGPDWNDVHRARPGAIRDALTEPDIPFNVAEPSEDPGYSTGEPPGNGDARGKRIIVPTPYVWREPSKIPLREWLYGKHYIRKYISATFAPGGLGKTSLALVEAIAMAAGRPLLGVPVPKRLRVWYWNGEDPAEETERRIAAILSYFKIPREEIEGWLFTDTGRKTPICIARRQKNDVIFTPDADALIQAIKQNSIDVFILDPFVKTHNVPENDNGAIDSVARTFAAIADEAGCSIELTHHVRKVSSFGRAEVTVDDGRGAGALKDASRSIRVMNTMAPEEAVGAQVKPKDCKRYFRVDDNAKANMAAPAESATWYKIISVPLFNNPEDSNAFGDSVGVVISWKLPGVFAGVPGNALTLVQDTIEAGGPWARNTQAEDWAGYGIADALDLDASDTVQKERVKRMLDAWIETGALKASREPSPKNKSRMRPTVIVGSRTVGGET
jgi:hypothetical protein